MWQEAVKARIPSDALIPRVNLGLCYDLRSRGWYSIEEECQGSEAKAIVVIRTNKINDWVEHEVEA